MSAESSDRDEQTLAGIDIGGTSVKLGIVRSGQALGVVAQRSIPTRPSDPAEVFARRVADAVLELVGSSGQKITGAGVGCPGLIDPKKGMVTKSPNLPNLPGFPLRDALRARLGVDVEIQNDANAAALGEWLYGPNKGVSNLIMITLGTGVGGGVICDGHLLSGADNAAAELGHVKIDFEDSAAPCGCGMKGCIEAYAGAGGIARLAKQVLGANHPTLRDGALTTREISESAKAGDAPARQALERVGEYIGRALSIFIDTFNPEVIVLGGGASAAIEWFRPGINRALDRYCSFPETRKRCRIERSAFPDDINVIGAAATYLNLNRQ